MKQGVKEITISIYTTDTEAYEVLRFKHPKKIIWPFNPCFLSREQLLGLKQIKEIIVIFVELL